MLNLLLTSVVGSVAESVVSVSGMTEPAHAIRPADPIRETQPANFA